MADSKISALTAATAAAGTNEIPINEAGTSKKLTVAQILALATGTAVPLVESGSGAHGAAGLFADELHVHPGAFATATPALTLGTTNSAGAATTSVATDATIALFDATDPLALAAAAAHGATGFAADAGHVHPQPVTVSTFWKPVYVGASSSVAVTQNRLYFLPVFIPVACTLTGIVTRTGATANGNVKVALFSAAGTKLAESSAATQANAYAAQQVAFGTPYAAAPGLYHLGVVSDSATATMPQNAPAGAAGNVSNGYTTIPDITPAAMSQVWTTPELSTY